jgi:beta-lactam-binding protein with PASTA domain
MRSRALIAGLLLLVLPACGGGAEPRAVPDVRGERLDVAQERLDEERLEYERVGGGTFGIVVEANWRVCDQEPKPGERATRVRLVVDRHCPPPPRPAFFVPDLVGDDLDDASARLDRRELPYRVVGPRGARPVVVCSQDPPGGSRAAEVVLYVAVLCDPPPAPAPLPPQLPDLVGLDLGEAVELLAARGIGHETEPASTESYHDVCSQHPPAGARAWTVTLYVARRC